MVGSPQTLSEAERRLIAAWAADCAERSLGLFEAERPADMRPRAAIERARAYARGELDTASEIKRRFVDGGAAGDARSPAAAAAARAAGQAAAVCHMGAHGLGAAGYAAKSVALVASNRDASIVKEVEWQVAHMPPAVRAALRCLPALGEDRSGPLGPGLLTSGDVGVAIRLLQSAIA